MTMRSRPIAGAVVTALGALGILAGTAQAEQATVSGGHLDWGLKQSFRNYISGPIAHGAITASDVAAAIKKAGGPPVDKRAIDIPKPIKLVGTHTVGVKLHDGVTAHVPLTVVAQS